MHVFGDNLLTLGVIIVYLTVFAVIVVSRAMENTHRPLYLPGT